MRGGGGGGKEGTKRVRIWTFSQELCEYFPNSTVLFCVNLIRKFFGQCQMQ